MRITIIGSVKFAKSMVELFHELERMGHEPLMHEWMFGIADGSRGELIGEIASDHSLAKRKHGFIKAWHGLIKSGDAVLVCNMDKDGISNYIGGNTLMEMGFAHVNDKKVFLLNPPPDGVAYADEINAMTDLVLENDLTRISSHQGEGLNRASMTQ